MSGITESDLYLIMLAMIIIFIGVIGLFLFETKEK